MKKFKLFCLPYAGGSAAMYNKWRQYLDRRIELHPLELAGRGRRIYDPLYDSIAEAVDDVYKIIESQLDQMPYCFFGHSMGGIIAYELALKIKNLQRPQPVHIFFAGRGAPNIPGEDEKNFHQLPEEEFKKEILELGGTPREFFEHPELLDVLMPMLRSDFKIAETYKFPEAGEIKPLDYDISVFIGKEEEVTAGQMHGWREHTAGICTVYYFPGEHFFINEETERIVKIINHTLLSI
ncbi:MAG: Thioesterase [Acidobacteriota bacterium]|nr:Thioesterase [Acidobacteriota bacterium]